MMTRQWGLLAVSALVLAACDVVRVPGDGRLPPDPKPAVPDGAPGPPPPVTPVDDPYGEGDGSGEDPVETPQTPDGGDTPTDLDPVEPDPDSEPEDPIEEPPVSPPPPPALPVKFEYFAPGDLIPGTGTGRGDDTVYAPDMLFPIKTAPTWPQSMVYRLGGAVGGDQCDPANYDIPWRDNFCEKRSSTRNTPLCPTNQVHQGQDIRVGSAADCNTLRGQAKADRGLHEVIAVEDGIIQHIGTYSVQLKGTQTGNIYSYLHLNMRRLRVSALDTVSAGDTLGFVSNDFGSTPTTFHLHFEIKAPIEGEGIVHVPPYMSLVAAYERREEGRGEVVEDDTVAIASLPVFPDDIDIVE
ncbi:MAG: M23 family metallopeptidase [Pseudomonadota bacterium]|nr:M23 family metallopeptidase [Pseudomonadota bacterium]